MRRARGRPVIATRWVKAPRCTTMLIPSDRADPLSEQATTPSTGWANADRAVISTGVINSAIKVTTPTTNPSSRISVIDGNWRFGANNSTGWAK